MDILFTTPPLPSHPPSIDLFVACPPPALACLSTRTSQNTIPHLRISKLMAYEDGERHPFIFFPTSPSVQGTHCKLNNVTVGRSPPSADPLCAITVHGLDVGARPTFLGSDEEYQVGNGMGGEMGRMEKKAVDVAFTSDSPTMGTCIQEYLSHPLPRSVDVDGKPSPWILMHFNHPLDGSLSASYLDMNAQPSPNNSSTLYSCAAKYGRPTFPSRFDIRADFSLLDLYHDPWLCPCILGFSRCLSVDGNLYRQEDGVDMDIPVPLLSIDLIPSRTTHATAVSLYSARDEIALAQPLGFGLKSDDCISLEVNVLDVFATWVARERMQHPSCSTYGR
ncbi:hypothetical protein ONZ45_g2003 [Pleurotus djamor]|nr:hypothetical protein ONZ45_g2003 [Pleurotus djamor]